MVVRAWFGVCRSRLIHGFAMGPNAEMQSAPTQSAAKCAQMHMQAIHVNITDMCATSMHESLGTINGIMLALDQTWNNSIIA